MAAIYMSREVYTIINDLFLFSKGKLTTAEFGSIQARPDISWWGQFLVVRGLLLVPSCDAISSGYQDLDLAL